MENSFETRYKTGDTPWDHGTPDVNLFDMVKHLSVQNCKALDIGCGTGDNAIWLAQQGFDVTACDLSCTAIEKAKEKASEANVECSFIVADFLDKGFPVSSFGFVFDRGCLHSVGAGSERMMFSKNVASCLKDEGLWLTLTGNADEQAKEIGPPQLTAGELIAVMEPFFEVISITAGYFGSDQSQPPKAWVCLAQKR